MGTEETSANMVPPYVPFRTLLTFSDGLRQAIPQCIDRSVMHSMSGTIQRQLMYALRYLKLIDDDGIPQENLVRWIKTEGHERQEALRTILQVGYPFLLGNSANGFDLANATSRQFREKFQSFDIQGTTLRKAEAFFLHAASHAGLTISSYIKKPTRQQGEPPRRPGRPRNGQKSNRRNGTVESPVRSVDHSTDGGKSQDITTVKGQQAFAWDTPSPASNALGEGFILLGGLLRQLPTDRQWTQARRDQWLTALTAMLDFLIKVVEPGNEAQQEVASQLAL